MASSTSFANSALGSARNCFAVTPHNTNPVSVLTKGLYVGTGGDIAVRTSGSSQDVVFKAVPSGMILDIQVSHVRATGTTASAIVGMA